MTDVPEPVAGSTDWYAWATEQEHSSDDVRAMAVSVADYGTVDTTGSVDSTTAVQAAITAAYNAGGGTVVFPAGTIKCTGQLTVPNDGATPPKQAAIRLQGAGAHFSGRGTAIVGGTTLNLTATVTYGKIQTSGLGLLACQDITFNDTSGGNSPFIYTTNTTLQIDQCGFVGSKTGSACDQDAIILGGPNQVEGGGGLTDGFQGFGTVISRNFFSGIRVPVRQQAFANAVRVIHNTVWSTCGNSAGAAFEIDGKPTTGTQKIAGGTVGFNLIELTNYQYGIRLKNALAVNLIGNDFYDNSTATCGIYLDSTTTDCYVLAGYNAGGSLQYLIDNSSTTIFQEINASGVASVDPKPRVFRGAVHATGQSGAGVAAMDDYGNGGYVKAPAYWTTVGGVWLASRPARIVADGATTSGSATLTSATAAFVSSDQGQPIGAQDGSIPSGTFIAQVVNSTTVTMTKTATATGTGKTIGFGRLGTETQQILFEKQHICSQGSAPTAATGAGAGTGGTVSVAGTDAAGTVTVNVGTSPGTGRLALVTHAVAHSGTQHIVVTPADPNAGAAYGPKGIWAWRWNASSWELACTTALTASTSYQFNYVVVEAA